MIAATAGAVRPGAARLAVSTHLGHALVWDTATWEPVRQPLSPAEGGVFHVAYSPDGQYLVTSQADGELLLRDPETYQPLGARPSSDIAAAGLSSRSASAPTARGS